MAVKTIFESMEYGPAPEDSAAAMDWLKAHDKFKFFIDGKWQAPVSKKYFDSINPCTTEVLAKIPQANLKDVDKAVKAAKKALPGWSKRPPQERARLLYAIARHLQKNSRLFAVLESLDNGKTVRETRDIDIPLAVRHFYHHAGWAQVMETELKDYCEIGVVGQIIPWNFPLLMMAILSQVASASLRIWVEKIMVFSLPMDRMMFLISAI